MRLIRLTLKATLTAIGLLFVFGTIARSAPETTHRTHHDTDGVPGFVDRLEIVSRETAFGGQTFGRHGSYERIVAIAHYKLDPDHPANQRIADLNLAPRGTDGLVNYQTDVVILRPVAARQARRLLVYDVVNRGGFIIPSQVNDVPITFAAQFPSAGNGFLMRQGYTLVWSGWQADLTAPATLKARFPIARSPDGATPITGQVQVETVFDNHDKTGKIMLTYPVAASGPATEAATDAETVAKTVANTVQAELTVRATQLSPVHIIPRDQWRMVDTHTVEVQRPANFDAGAIYRFVYRARDPWINGLAFASVRDLLRFLRRDASDAQGQPNPLVDLRTAPCERDGHTGQCLDAGANVDRVIGLGVSQSGRFLRDWLWQGFNDAGQGQRVFDGVLSIVPGSRKASINHRWAQPSRFSRQHEEHLVYGNQFPFSYATVIDPLTGATDGILKRCQENDTCPRLFHLDTSAEFWQAGASLIASDGLGRDYALPPNVRAYLVAGGTHAAGMTSPACALPRSDFSYGPVTRALLVAMEDWVTNHAAPPDSRWPSAKAGTLQTLDQMRARFPDLSGVNAALRTGPPTAINTVPHVDYAAVPPHVLNARGWPVQVPVTDADGNDLAGIRLPPIAVPRGTYFGWNVRRPGYAEGQLCFIFGAHLPFASTRADRPAGDSRLSIEERYASDADYLARLRAAGADLRAARLLLVEDVRRYADDAKKALAAGRRVP